MPATILLLTSFVACASAQSLSALPTCGNNSDDFASWDAAGCYCEFNSTSSCIAGFAAPYNIVSSSRPLGYWLLGGTNATVTDSSGSGLTGTFVGTLNVDYAYNAVVAANVSFAPMFSVNIRSSTLGYINFGVTPSANFGKRDFVIEIWWRTTSVAVTAIMLSKRNTCGNGNYWSVSLQHGQVQFEIDQDGSGTNLASALTPQAYNDGQWHLVHAVRSGVNITVFVDGIQRANASCTGVINVNNTNPMLFGNFPCASGQNFVGDIGQFAMYVDINTPPQLGCAVVQGGSATGSYLTLPFATRHACKTVSGFCNPSQPNLQCCAAAGCAECAGYRSCSLNFTAQSTLPTSSTIMTTFSSAPTVTTSSRSTVRTPTASVLTTTTSATTTPVATTTSFPATTAASLTTSIIAKTSTTSASPTSPNNTVTIAANTIGTSSGVGIASATPENGLPAWVYGALGGLGALVLFISGIAVACWCSKRSRDKEPVAVQMAAASDSTVASSDGCFRCCDNYSHVTICT
jgi:hypothetical protein